MNKLFLPEGEISANLAIPYCQVCVIGIKGRALRTKQALRDAFTVLLVSVPHKVRSSLISPQSFR